MNAPIIDACVAIKWFLPEINHEKAGVILRKHKKMIAPDLFYIEMDAIITKKVRQKLINSGDAYKIYNEIRNIPFEIIPYKMISKMAFDLSTSLSITQYDACYLSVAIEFDQPFYTADNRLIRTMNGTPFENYIRGL